MTLQQSKETCDNLKDKCIGFIVQSNDNRDKNAATFFVAALEPGFEDPNTYDRIFTTPDERNKEQSSLTSYQNYTSYIKKDVTYVEKTVKELNIPGQQFEKRGCSITNTPEYDLESMTGVLDDCKARCVTMDNCSGFNRTANVPDDKSATCQLKKVNFDFKITNCPPGYHLDRNSGNCVTGWTNQCGEDCARSKCASENGTWIPLDYRSNPYTCRPDQSKIVPICNNNQPNFGSYVRTGVKGANPNIPDPPKFEAPPQLKNILNNPQGGPLNCPTGNKTFDYPGSLNPNDASQALSACEACFGKNSCTLVTSDCAGYGYGPNRSYNEYGTIPVFGYQGGCSGGAGRVWKWAYSYDWWPHYGTWGSK